jgi:hypothetical protein
MTVSARRLPISGSWYSPRASFAVIARAIAAGSTAIARSAFRLPIPFTVVKSSKKSRSCVVVKPISRGT